MNYTDLNSLTKFMRKNTTFIIRYNKNEEKEIFKFIEKEGYTHGHKHGLTYPLDKYLNIIPEHVNCVIFNYPNMRQSEIVYCDKSDCKGCGAFFTSCGGLLYYVTLKYQNSQTNKQKVGDCLYTFPTWLNINKNCDKCGSKLTTLFTSVYCPRCD